jgi:peptidoglycan/xylan/chitin deacetylase (PgdA/CDA1 family)
MSLTSKAAERTKAYKKNPLRVLMYHKVSDNGHKDGLTVTSSDLDEQFRFLKQQGYTSILLSDLTNYVLYGTHLPPKPVLITFDDGYRDNYTIMYPILLKHGLKANIFLVPAFLQTTPDGTSADGETYLQVSDLHAMDPGKVEYGLHSYDHKNYKQLSEEEIAQDIKKTREFLTGWKIPFQQCLAFPYGSYPKRNAAARNKFLNTLSANNITLAFRIGNRLNPLPISQSLLIQRLDIRGDEPAAKFERKLRKGKAWF